MEKKNASKRLVEIRKGAEEAYGFRSGDYLGMMTSSAENQAFVKGALFADKTTIEKIDKFLEEYDTEMMNSVARNAFRFFAKQLKMQLAK